MAIRVVPGAADLAGDLAERFLVQVTGSSDPDKALAAVNRARDDIARLAFTADPEASPPILSNAVLGPHGPLLRVARLDSVEGLAQRVPALIAKALTSARLRSATIDVLVSGGPLDELDDTPNAVVLRVFPAPGGVDGEVPAGWIDVAADWVLGELSSSATVPLRLLGAAFEVGAADAPATLHQARAARTWCDLVSGDLRDRVRTASLTFGQTPHLSLAAGGPCCDPPSLLARYELLCDIARELSDGVAYACVDFESTFEMIGLGLSSDGWHGQRHGAPPNAVAGAIVDVRVPDAFPFQILGPGHLAHLQERARRGNGAIGEPLDGGRAEVALGASVDWMPSYEAREEEEEHGWKVLSDLLVDDAELERLRHDRPATSAGEEREATPAALGGPALDQVTLDALPHRRRGLRLTLLELVAWQAHEPHSDDPRTVSPVLATFARWFSASLEPDLRQELKGSARRLIGTRGRSLDGAAARPLPPADDARVWLAAEWLARVQAPAWLRLAGRPDHAATLEGMRSRANRSHLARAAAVLGAAIVDVADADQAELPPEVDGPAWSAWERAAEVAAWVAASETASVRVPELLGYAVEQPVIAAARNARLRAYQGGRRTTIEAEARAAALAAAAEDAWVAGTDAAAAAMDPSAEVPFRTALDRATRAVGARIGVEQESVETSLEVAEAAARAALVDAIASDAPPASPWDAARDAATESEGGAAWTAAQQMAQDAVGADAWETGMERARTIVRRVLQTAPELIDRAVVVALAREASGVAARAVARRAVIEALEAGAEPAAAGDAAYTALAPTAEGLRRAGFELLDTLIGARRERRPRRKRRT
ncbi:MAG: hypothetical protein Q8K58_09335 [Acidimicrobiales bacterium]|nr:hypothetical protein [Acidimicrobiales bacterium]